VARVALVPGSGIGGAASGGWALAVDELLTWQSRCEWHRVVAFGKLGEQRHENRRAVTVVETPVAHAIRFRSIDSMNRW
jgi:hypothetical protein